MWSSDWSTIRLSLRLGQLGVHDLHMNAHKFKCQQPTQIQLIFDNNSKTREIMLFIGKPKGRSRMISNATNPLRASRKESLLRFAGSTSIWEWLVCDLVVMSVQAVVGDLWGRLGGEKGTREECQIRNAHLLHQPSQRPSWSSLELYTSKLHSASTGLPQTDPISRQAPPPRSYELQSQRKNPSAYSLKNSSLVGHHPQTFPRLHSA